jgi:hypothetical protein
MFVVLSEVHTTLNVQKWRSEVWKRATNISEEMIASIHSSVVCVAASIFIYTEYRGRTSSKFAVSCSFVVLTAVWTKSSGMLHRVDW